MLVPLVLSLLAAAPDTAWGTLRGTVQSDPGGAPVPLAVVEVHSGPRTFSVTADSAGGYVLAHVPAGRQTLVVRHLTHLPRQLEVLIPANAELALDLVLQQRTLSLDTVQVRGAPLPAALDSVAAPRPELADIDRHAIEEGAGAAGSAFGGGGGKQGGGNGPADPGDVLYVRGSAADLKLVLLDGAPVYAPFHTGGLVETFEPGVLSAARLYLGGAPPRYDGGLSYVMDLSTRAPNHERAAGTGSLDMMAARAMVEGPLPRGASYLLSGRVVHGASVARLEDAPFPYVFGDALGRVDLPLGVGHLSATGFVNREGVRVDTIPGREHFARWGNRAASLRFRGPLAGVPAEVTAAVGDFDAFLPRGALRMEAHARRMRLGLDLDSREGALRLRYGWSYERLWFSHRVLDRTNGQSELLDAQSSGDVTGAYLDAAIPVESRLLVRGGARADMFSGGPFVSLSPRLSATWLLSDHAALTLAGGRYHQYVRVQREFPFEVGMPSTADSLGIATDLRVATADHLALTLDQELVEGLRLGLEGYYKHFTGIPVPDEVGAYTSGVDVWVRRGGGPVEGWLGYSLAWSWSQPDGATTSREFQGRQIVSAGASGSLGRGARFGVRLAYGAGLPYTAVGDVPTTPAPDTPPSPGSGGTPPSTGGAGSGTELIDGDTPLGDVLPDPYFRIDAEIARTWTPRVGTRVTHLTPYLRVVNALNRRDALFYRYNPGEDEAPRGVATLPVLPIFGVEWKF